MDTDRFFTFVYFVYDPETHEIKIGESQEPRNRIAQLEADAGHSLIVLAIIKDQMPLEKVMHLTFDHLMTSGERFTAAPELIEYINNLHFNGNTNVQKEENDQQIYTKECSLCGDVFVKASPIAARNALNGHINRVHKER